MSVPATSMTSDRTVHARTNSDAEIVRYDSAGKWYIEWPGTALIPRRRLSLQEAVKAATNPGSTQFFGRPGGKLFDARARTRLAALDEKP